MNFFFISVISCLSVVQRYSFFFPLKYVHRFVRDVIISSVEASRREELVYKISKKEEKKEKVTGRRCDYMH